MDKKIQQFFDKIEERLPLFSYEDRLLSTRIVEEILFSDELISSNHSLVTYKKNIISAADTVLDSLDVPGKLSMSVRKAEDILSPLSKKAKEYTVHYVGHAHIDVNWLWNWQETVDVAYQTFKTVLALMKEYPSFIFSQSQAALYNAIKEHCPEQFEEIKQKVAEGRWEVTASNWTEGDENLACGESLTRQVLYAKDFLSTSMNLDKSNITVVWQPDLFGHSSAVPQILSNCGLKYYYFCRGRHKPYDNENLLPQLFWWTSESGNKILAFDDSCNWYDTNLDVGNKAHPSYARKVIGFEKDCGLKDYMVVYGIGDHGGGPTRRDLDSIIRMQAWPVFPNIKFSRASDFFNIAENGAQNLQCYSKEMNPVFDACYSSTSMLKTAHRESENKLLSSETISTATYFTKGVAYPAESYKQAWKNVLLNQFHDVLPGTCILESRNFALGLYQQANAIAENRRNYNLDSIAADIDTQVDGIPVLIYNTLARQKSEGIVVRLWDVQTDSSLKKWPPVYPHFDADDVIVTDCDGIRMPAQICEQGFKFDHNYVDVATVYKKIPSVGYKLFNIKMVKEPLCGNPEKKIAVFSKTLNNGNGFAENEYISIEIEKETGTIVHINSKTADIRIDDKIGNLQIYNEEDSAGNAWDMGNVKKVENAVQYVDFKLLETGPARACFEWIGKYGASTFVQKIILWADKKQVEYHLQVDWREFPNPEKSISLRVSFPTAKNSDSGYFDIPSGSIQRDFSERHMPILKWVSTKGYDDRSHAEYALSYSNDSRYGMILDKHAAILTLLRSTEIPEPYNEIGRHQIRYSIDLYEMDASISDFYHTGDQFNQNLLYTIPRQHPGENVKKYSFLNVDEENVAITAIKMGEDGDSLVIRAREIEGKKSDVSLNVNMCIGTAFETDSLENTEKVRLEAVHNTVRLSFEPKEIKTIKIIPPKS